jgi:hypothetical protein
MIEIQNYNESVLPMDLNRVQYSFKIDGALNKKDQKKEFNDQISTAIKTFFSELRYGIKAKPMSQSEFDGIKAGNIEYSSERLVGFPYRIGFLKYKVGSTTFFKCGIMIETFKLEK